MDTKVITDAGTGTLFATSQADGNRFKAKVTFTPDALLALPVVHVSPESFDTAEEALGFAGAWASKLHPTRNNRSA